MKYFLQIIFVLVLLPTFAFAQFVPSPDTSVSGSGYINLPSAVGVGMDGSNPNSGYAGGDKDVGQASKDAALSVDGSYGGTTINSNTANSVCSLTSKSIKGYVDYLGCAARVAVLPFIIGIAVLAFVWGVVTMIVSPANEEAQAKGKTFILWGIIGFFVITSVYALVGIIRRTVNFSDNGKDDPSAYNRLKDKVQKLK